MQQKNFFLIGAEILVIGGILFAFISPLFSPSPEETTEGMMLLNLNLPMNLG